MFDIGFAELLLIAVVGLLVIGPERLPSTIRTVSLWIGRFRRSFNEIRSEIEREVGADDIRRQLHNESIMASLNEGRDALERQAKQISDELNSIGDTPAENTKVDSAIAPSEESATESTSDTPPETAAVDEPQDHPATAHQEDKNGQ